MNGVDYSKAIARERDNYQASIKKDREQSAKIINDGEERHERIQKKQADVFDNDRRELEEDYKTNIDGIKERTSESIERQKNAFHEKNRAEQNRFENERSTARKEFDTRMRDITSSYDRAMESQQKTFDTQVETQKKNNHANYQRLNSDKEAKLKDFKERMEGSGANIRDQYRQEKAEQVHRHAAEVEEMYKAEAGKRAALKTHLQNDLERVNQAHAAEREQSQNYVKDKVSTLSNQFNDRSVKMAKDYSDRNAKGVEKAANENKATARQHQLELAEARRNYEKNIRNIELDRRRRDNGSGEFAEVMERQNGLKDDQVYEDKINRLKSDLTAAKSQYGERFANETDKFKETLHEQSVDANVRVERKEKELMADKLVTVANEREKSSKSLMAEQASKHAEVQRYEHQLMLERNQSQDQIKKLKANFNASLQNLQEQNEKFVKDLSSQSTGEKTKFITESNVQRNEEIQLLRRNFNKLMDTTVNEYETRLSMAGNENAQLKDELDMKVATIREDASRNIADQTTIYNDKKKADLRAAQVRLDQREAQFKNKILELSTSFQRRMDNQQYVNESKLKQTVNEYDSQLKMQHAQNTKEMSEKDNLHKEELKRLKSALEQEKAQIIAQYENEMNQMKIAQKQELERLNDYKKMG